MILPSLLESEIMLWWSRAQILFWTYSWYALLVLVGGAVVILMIAATWGE